MKNSAYLLSEGLKTLYNMILIRYWPLEKRGSFLHQEPLLHEVFKLRNFDAGNDVLKIRRSVTAYRKLV